MAKENIKVLIKRPKQDPTMEVIPNTLEALQGIVEGFIETYTFAKGQCIICNEEGYLLKMPYAAHICGIMFRGPIIFVGVDGEDFTDTPLSYGEFKRCFPTLWEEIDDGNN